jgi:hypothetical protein
LHTTDYGLAPGKRIMLRYAFPIVCTGVVKNADGTIKEVTATTERDAAAQAKGGKPPKGVVHWVSEPTPGKLLLFVSFFVLLLLLYVLRLTMTSN